MNDLPLMERWLLKDHAAETLSLIGPILDRYVSYRAVPAPTGAEPYGYYNWRMTEHWWKSAPFSDDPLDQGTSFSEIWPEGYTSILGLPDNEARSKKWGGSPDGLHPPIHAFVPRRPTQDFKGKGLTMRDGTVLRWIVAHRYPDGVTRQQGDEWFIQTHAPEVCKQPGLKRFFSFNVIEPVTSPFVRISELWYENANAWRRAVIESPTKYTAPPWAKLNRYPFLEPFVDFVSTFILEAPTNDFKENFGGYVFTA
jgi:hypothetical protein